MSTTISGTTGIDKVQDGTTINASSIMGALNATGTAPIYACRAWVNFNGAGTVAIRGSGNVSSITDNGTGDYTVNFTTAMIDANYSSSVGQLSSVANPSTQYVQLSSKTASALRLLTVREASVNDAQEISIAIHR